MWDLSDMERHRNRSKAVLFEGPEPQLQRTHLWCPTGSRHRRVTPAERSVAPTPSVSEENWDREDGRRCGAWRGRFRLRFTVLQVVV